MAQTIHQFMNVNVRSNWIDKYIFVRNNCPKEISPRRTRCKIWAAFGIVCLFCFVSFRFFLSFLRYHLKCLKRRLSLLVVGACLVDDLSLGHFLCFCWKELRSKRQPEWMDKIRSVFRVCCQKNEREWMNGWEQTELWGKWEQRKVCHSLIVGAAAAVVEITHFCTSHTHQIIVFFSTVCLCCCFLFYSVRLVIIVIVADVCSLVRRSLWNGPQQSTEICLINNTERTIFRLLSIFDAFE